MLALQDWLFLLFPTVLKLVTSKLRQDGVECLLSQRWKQAAGQTLPCPELELPAVL